MSLERKTPLPRTGRLTRKRAMRKRNPGRRASEFSRCYGSRERVRFIKALPCAYCVALLPFLAFVEPADCGPSDNAHTVSGGKGRKADYDTIIPLCRRHHRMYDEHHGVLGDPDVRAYLQQKAADVEALWQRECVRRGARSSGQGAA